MVWYSSKVLADLNEAFTTSGIMISWIPLVQLA